jgi:hypothetical protein
MNSGFIFAISSQSMTSQYKHKFFSALRIFSVKSAFDTLTVTHKFVEDLKFLLECFTVISKGNCFLSVPTAKLYGRQSGASKANSKVGVRNTSLHVFQCFPQWFTPQKGGTIYEWICAFFEYILLSK